MECFGDPCFCEFLCVEDVDLFEIVVLSSQLLVGCVAELDVDL